MKKYFTLLLVVFSFAAKAQKFRSIEFNLYTDSLKKGVHNYINVVGKLPDGKYFPLMTDEILFSSSAGKWDGNSLIIDSAYVKDSIVVSACLKNQPGITSSTVIFMKKNLVEDVLKTESELLEEWKRKGKSRN